MYFLVLPIFYIYALKRFFETPVNAADIAEYADHNNPHTYSSNIENMVD